MLIDHINAHLRRTKMSATRFGRDAVGDPNFICDLLDGRRPRAKTVSKVMAYIEAREAAAPELENAP